MQLDKEWLTQGLIDFEYKKYVLLAYLKNVKEEFGQGKLYPCLSDIIFHYQNLLSLKENKQLIFENFPKEITKADFERLTLTYQKIIDDDNVMQELEEIILYSLPQLKDTLNEGKDIYEYVEENLQIYPVGVASISNEEGFLFINVRDKPDTSVYQYHFTIFESANEKFRGVHTTFLENVRSSLGRSFETIKLDLVKKYGNLTNPATYMVESKVVVPFQETILPIAKRLLVKYISTTWT
ncbi:MAG TPA: hypothetical protein VD908_02540 [Cytophagales bacterium]|nr:hypothetical protein [Cytophagales bacterium]